MSYAEGVCELLYCFVQVLYAGVCNADAVRSEGGWGSLGARCTHSCRGEVRCDTVQLLGVSWAGWLAH